MKLGKAEYDIIDGTQTVAVSSPIEKIVSEEVDANILPSKAKEILDRESGEKVEVPRASYEDGEGTEHYGTTLDIKFPVKQSDDLYLKKRKKLNRLTDKENEAEF